MREIRSCFHNHIYRCSFVENGKVTNNLEWCFNATNETDFITRDNNVSCYILWDRIPDQNQLITGRSDTGRLMFQYRGLNWDNQSANATMPIKLNTKFWGLKQPINFRVKKAWLNVMVLGAAPINVGYYVDTRNALSDRQTDEWATQGEYKSPTNFIRINSQQSITSRQVLKHEGADGQSIGFEIDQNIQNTDFAFSSINFEVIVKKAKRNQKVGV